MLEAARLPDWGPLRGLQIEGLGLVYLGAFRAWLGDDSEDLGATMSALDNNADDSDSSDGVPEIGLDALRPEALAALLSVKQARETAAADATEPSRRS